MKTLHMASHPRGESFLHLVGDLQTDVKTLIKKEIELAKTEMGEKFKDVGRNAGFAAAGAVMALIAVFMLLLGLGAVIARLLQAADMNPGTAYFLAYMGLSLVLGGVGYFLIRKALNAFSNLSLSPEKALETVRGPEAVEIEIRHQPVKEAKPSSDELRDEVVAARARMDSEVLELKERLTPGYMLRSSLAGIKHHPLRALLFGASAGVGGYFYWRNRHLAELNRVKAQRKWWQVKIKHV
jgi:hypothetical protein